MGCDLGFLKQILNLGQGNKMFATDSVAIVIVGG